MRKVKIWHVGGEDVHMRIPLLQKISKLGYQVGAVGTSDPSKFIGTGVEYFEIPLSRWFNPFSDVSSFIALRRLVKLHNPDIVHGFDTKPSILAPLAVSAARNSTRSVRTINGMGYLYSESNLVTTTLKPVYELLQRVVSRVVGHTIFQNSVDKMFFEQKALVRRDRYSLISGSGVEKPYIDPAELNAKIQELSSEFSVDNRKVVTMVARLVKNKGVLEFLEAARHVRSSRKDIVFLLVGPYASEGSQAVDESLLNQYHTDVIVTGPRQDVPAILGLTSVFVLPTNYREGVPRALLEAAMAGLPLVATNMPGCTDVIDHGNNGLLIEPRDSVGLGTAIETILDDLVAWKKRACFRQETVKSTFGIDTVVEAHDEVYKKLYSMN
jgi:glycosyltransferase involved in cell wall biosynthesis